MDSTTGLDYYNARSYDAPAGQFASADSVAAGLNRYAYVGGNPETATDPSGHRMMVDVPGGSLKQISKQWASGRLLSAPHHEWRG